MGARQKRTRREFRQFLKDKRIRRSNSMPGTAPQQKPKDKVEFDRFKTYLKLVGRQRPKSARPTLQSGETDEIVLEPTAEFLYAQCQKGQLKPEQITADTITDLDKINRQDRAMTPEGTVLCVVKEASISLHRGNSDASIEVNQDALSSSADVEPYCEKTLNLPSEQDFKDFQKYKALISQKRPKLGRKMPSRMDFEKFLKFKRAHGKSADQELPESDMEEACQEVSRIFSTRSGYQKKNILHDGLWSDISDNEARAQAQATQADLEQESIGSFALMCFLGGVATVTLINYMFTDDQPRYPRYYYPRRDNMRRQ